MYLENFSFIFVLLFLSLNSKSIRINSHEVGWNQLWFSFCLIFLRTISIDTKSRIPSLQICFETLKRFNRKESNVQAPPL